MGNQTPQRIEVVPPKKDPAEQIKADETVNKIINEAVEDMAPYVGTLSATELFKAFSAGKIRHVIIKY